MQCCRSESKWCGSASGIADPDPALGERFLRVLYFLFSPWDIWDIKKLSVLHHLTLKKNIFCPLYFGCLLWYPDPFSPSRCGSGSGQIMRNRQDPDTDPDTQHCHNVKVLTMQDALWNMDGHWTKIKNKNPDNIETFSSIKHIWMVVSWSPVGIVFPFLFSAKCSPVLQKTRNAKFQQAEIFPVNCRFALLCAVN